MVLISQDEPGDTDRLFDGANPNQASHGDTGRVQYQPVFSTMVMRKSTPFVKPSL